MQEWISVKNQKPALLSLVTVKCKDSDVEIEAEYGHNGVGYAFFPLDTYQYTIANVEYWKPLK